MAYKMAGLLKYLQRDILMSAIYQKMQQGKRSIDDWTEAWTNGQIHGKASIVKSLQKQPLHMLSTRDPPHNKGHIQSEHKGLEKGMTCKWIPK